MNSGISFGFDVSIESFLFTSNGLTQIETLPLLVMSREDYADLLTLGEKYVAAEWTHPINEMVRHAMWQTIHQLYEAERVIPVGFVKQAHWFTPIITREKILVPSTSDGKVVYNDRMYDVVEGYSYLYHLKPTS